ncbi:hypothetical protein ACFS5N_12360 [Mucilaginibacter ximonensis]|uniref:Uncharacterized protein n=1 Tax=Mucilaginibacter ximonensis TaxID=538021 RepID=A0ABW5YD09_9SPHI
MKSYKIIPAILISTLAMSCSPGNGNKAEQKGPDTVRTDTSALKGASDTTSRKKDSVSNKNAAPDGRIK